MNYNKRKPMQIRNEMVKITLLLEDVIVDVEFLRISQNSY